MDGQKEITMPNSLSIEESVIGALMIDEGSITEAMNILDSDCFFDPVCRTVFSVISEKSKSGDKIDIYTLGLSLDGIVKYSCLAEIGNRVASARNIETHCAILKELSIRRKLIALSSRIRSVCMDDAPVEDVTDMIQKEVNAMLSLPVSKVRSISDVMHDVFRVIQGNSVDSSYTGIRTGLSEFDNFCGGLHRTDLVIIAGETSQGKTSLALTIAKNSAVKSGAKVVFYSLEMSNIQLVSRLMSQDTGINSKAILRGRICDVKHVIDSTMDLSNAGIYFDDSSSTSIESISRSIKSMKRRYDIDLAVVDYLQLVSSNIRGANREQQVADIARTFKNLAKELDICIIALSQLRRSDNPKPSLNRLRDSGQIEEAADMIVFTYRPEAYNRQYDDPFKNFTHIGTALIDIAKGRNTGVFQFIASFRSDMTLFKDYSGGYYEPKKETFKD